MASELSKSVRSQNVILSKAVSNHGQPEGSNRAEHGTLTPLRKLDQLYPKLILDVSELQNFAIISKFK